MKRFLTKVALFGAIIFSFGVTTSYTFAENTSIENAMLKEGITDSDERVIMEFLSDIYKSIDSKSDNSNLDPTTPNSLDVTTPITKSYNGYSFTFNNTNACRSIQSYPTASTNSTFRDISRSYARNAIGKFQNLGIVNGTTPTTFQPFNNINRAEFLAIILASHCIKPYDSVSSIKFEDVSLNGWEARVIKKAVDLGIINGYDPKGERGRVLFKPKNNVSKIEALAIISRANNVILNSPYSHNFRDTAADWQNKTLNLSQALNLVDDSYYIYPNQPITREWMVKTMDRLLQRYTQ